MKLNYQLLRRLILEQLGTSQAIEQLRDHLGSEPPDLVSAAMLYSKTDNEIVDDYFEEGMAMALGKQPEKAKLEALKEPGVLIRVDDMIIGRDNRGRYVGAKLFTYDTTSSDFRGIPLGVLRVYPASQDQVSGSFLGDENFTLPYDETLFVDNRNQAQTNSEILDWLNEKLDAWVGGKGRQQYIEFILNA